MSASVVPERSAEALLCQHDMTTFTFTAATGELSVDCCPARLQSVVSTLRQWECLDVGPRSARAFGSGAAVPA